MRIPGIHWLHPARATLKAPVLEVIDGLEQPHGDECLEDEGEEGRETEDGKHADGEAPLEDQAVQHPVMQHANVQQSHVGVAESLGFEAPGAAELRRHRATPEARVALAKPGGCRVVWRPDARVVTAQVLGVEVFVEDTAEQQPTQPLFGAVAPVDEFVCGDDRKARAAANDQKDHQHVDGEDPLHAEQADGLGHDPELHPRERIHEQVEGPGGQALGALSPLAARRAVDLVGQHHRKHEERADVPRVRTRHEEYQRDGRDVERGQVPEPDPRDFGRVRGIVVQRGSGSCQWFLLGGRLDSTAISEDGGRLADGLERTPTLPDGFLCAAEGRVFSELTNLARRLIIEVANDRESIANREAQPCRRTRSTPYSATTR